MNRLRGIRVSRLFLVAAVLSGAGCASQAEVAMGRCRAISPPGSTAYESCWHREYQQQMRVYDEEAAWRRYQERKAGY